MHGAQEAEKAEKVAQGCCARCGVRALPALSADRCAPVRSPRAVPARGVLCGRKIDYQVKVHRRANAIPPIEKSARHRKSSEIQGAASSVGGAVAAAAAGGGQGQLGGMHDTLVDNGKAMGREDLDRFAKELGLVE